MPAPKAPRAPLPPQPQAQEALAFLHAPEAMLLLADRVILRASRMVEELFGWPLELLEGRNVRLLYPGQTDFESVGERARLGMLENPFFRDERFMRRRDGQIVWMEGRGQTLDRSDPHRLAIWSYRRMEGEASAAGILTPAERRVARHLIEGRTSKEMAKLIDCSPRTVEVHRANMIRKLGVRNSFELVRRLLDLGGNQP